MKKLVIISWLLLIALITAENLLNVRFEALELVLSSTTGASTSLWLADKFCKWIGPHIWNGIQEELRKPR